MIASDRASFKDEIERIIERPYTFSTIRNADGSWFAHVAEFEGCMTEGTTRNEALWNLDDAMRQWIRVHIEDQTPIPPPQDDEQFSGKFVVRVPRTVHRSLVERAKREGISLNLLVASALAKL